MPKRKTPEEKPEDQFKRFVKTAKEHEVSEAEAEKAFSALRASKVKLQTRQKP